MIETARGLAVLPALYKRQASNPQVLDLHWWCQVEHPVIIASVPHEVIAMAYKDIPYPKNQHYDFLPLYKRKSLKIS